VTFTPAQAAEEEYRAALWRAQTSRRVAYQTGLWNALAGSPAAYVALMAAWMPVIEWLAESAEPGTDPEDDYGQAPWLSDTVNVGRLSE
jgi:hypothetical protein